MARAAKSFPKSNPVARKAVPKAMDESGTHRHFPIVGIGASAGGLQVLTEFLKAMPATSGMAFVMVQHLDPKHESLMADLLGGHTGMPVTLAEDGMEVLPDHVYVIPPNAILLIEKGRLRLKPPVLEHGIRLPIDAFFRSLAEDCRNRAIGIVLSGTGTDGTLGLKAIREAGGFAIVQDPDEAPHDGMPRNAIANAAADEVLLVADMPDALRRFAEHPYVNGEGKPPLLGDRARDILPDVIALLKSTANMDFTLYKEGTLLRRIERRMSIRHQQDAHAYLELIKAEPAEVKQLAKDFLINVSSFFRDKAVFDYLETQILPNAVRAHAADIPFRIWSAGCATGEEAYSLAMLLIEQTEAQKRHLKIQIFATDLDADALATARNGVYPDSIAADVPPKRLARFFVKEDHRYHIKPELREAVVFAEHNLLSDAPFSKMDMVSCRNVLIYLDPKIQGQIMQLFHFALNEGGILLLGTSESPGAGYDLFDPVMRQHRVFRRIGSRSRLASVRLPISAPHRQRSLGVAEPLPAQRLAANPGDITRRLLLERYAPAAVLVNREAEGIYFSGPIDRFLKIPVGEAGQDLLAMVREGLRNELRTAIKQALADGRPVTASAVPISRQEGSGLVIMHVDPVEQDHADLLLVTFLDAPTPPAAPASTASDADRALVEQMERELIATRRELKITIRDLESSNEELKAANEEAMSMNEEFQSTNEELETSKEELQSLNEELTTLNGQLQQKVDDHRQAVDDLSNLINSAQVATIFLDRKLNIKRFTPSAKTLFNVIASDLGRPIGDITHQFDDDALISDARKVLEGLVPIEAEVRAKDGKWFQRRVLLYRTLDERVDGVVITLTDVTGQKESERRARAAQSYAEAIVDALREPLIVLDGDLKIVSAGRSFYEWFAMTPKETEGQFIFELGNRQWDIAALREALKRVVKHGSPLENFEVTREFPSLGERIMLLNASLVAGEGDRPDLILLAMEDITEPKRAKAAIERYNARLTSILQSAQVAIISIDEQGIVQSFSAAAENIFGYAAEEVIGHNVSMLMPEPDRARHDSYLAAYLKTGKTKIIGIGREVTGRNKDGTLIPLDLSIGEAYYDDSRLFTGSMRDLTADKKRQEELVQAQKMEAMGQLTGGVAHDFNNLLTIILGNLEILKSGKRPDLHEKLIAEAEEAVLLGGNLTRGLLAFSRRLPLRPEITDVNAIIANMSGMLKRTIPESITVVTKLQDDLWPIEIDTAQFLNAILNLGLNARDAMPDGGKLVIETRNVVLDSAYCDLHPNTTPGDYVAVAVTDTGRGMAPEVQRRAFEPFFTTKEVGKGTGLGLSMIYGFVKQSGGHATIESDPAQGTTAAMLLPRGRAQSKADTVPNVRMKTPAGHGETILVVEDDARVRQISVRRLEALGYVTLQADTGQAALAIIDSGAAVDLLITDMVMPGGMTGAELVAEVKRRRPDLPVLLTSGYSSEAFGVDNEFDILAKPYSEASLGTKVSEILSDQSR